jgi:hypothetical protein
MAMRHVLCAVVCSLSIAGTLAAQTQPLAFIFAHTRERTDYLAHAVIWRDPGPLTPEQIKQGPPAIIPEAIEKGANGEAIQCRFERPGSELGGATAKFSCRTPDGKSLRIKYYDGPAHGNREVFAEVVATRLMWALGFDADPMFSVIVNCLDCPANPATGEGPRAAHRYPAAFEPHYVGTIITSSKDPEQGWRFGELDKAIRSLPAGALRTRQRTHFDALSLLAVFIQHGDRKHSQQRLVCRGDIDLSKGDLHDIGLGDTGNFKLPVLFEHGGEQACVGESVVTIQDVGATFGGAGQFTRRTSAKINLKEWAGNKVFASATSVGSDHSSGGCHGNISVSGSAGAEAEENPAISEAGRQFLLAQLKRLTPEHIHAIFEAARVDEVGDENEWRDKRSGQTYKGIDAWVAAFQDKVAQIEEQHCGA